MAEAGHVLYAVNPAANRTIVYGSNGGVMYRFHNLGPSLVIIRVDTNTVGIEPSCCMDVRPTTSAGVEVNTADNNAFPMFLKYEVVAG